MRYGLTLFAILLMLILSSCNNATIDLQDNGVAEGQNKEPVAAHDTKSKSEGVSEKNVPSYEKSILIGTWQNESYISAVYKKRYHFYNDGTYLFEYENPGGTKRILSEGGLWDVENDTLVLAVKSKVTVEGGEEVETISARDWSHNSILNGIVKIIENSSSEKDKYITNNILQNAEESVNGRIKIVINGVDYWKVHDSPFAYQNKRQYKDGDVYWPTEKGKDVLFGTWHERPHIPSLYGERYHFYDDGTYIFEYSNYDLMTRTISEIGSWDFSAGILTLIVTDKVTIEGGEESKEALLEHDSQEYAIVNGIIRNIVVNPPERRENYVGNIYQDADKEGNGYLTMVINGWSYWKLIDDPDAYQNDFIEEGDTFNPWP